VIGYVGNVYGIGETVISQTKLTVSRSSECVAVLSSEAIRTDTATAVVRVLIAAVLTRACQ